MSLRHIDDLYLDNRLERALAKIIKTNDDDYGSNVIEVCNCHKGGHLFYNTLTGEYFGKGACKPDLLCYNIQKDKHWAVIHQTAEAYDLHEIEIGNQKASSTLNVSKTYDNETISFDASKKNKSLHNYY